MIMVQNTRRHGRALVVDPPHPKTIADALISLTKFELGFGGQVISLSPIRVVTRTVAMAADDTVTFSGSKEEMKPLVNVASFFLQVREAHGKEILESMAGPIVEAVHGNALMITHWGVKVIGTELTKMALLAGFFSDVSEPEAIRELESVHEAIEKTRIEDLVAALMLRQESAITLGEALDLAD